jgi:hypothetical protein
LFIREVYHGKPGQKSERGYILFFTLTSILSLPEVYRPERRKDTKSLVMLKGFSSGRI